MRKKLISLIRNWKSVYPQLKHKHRLIVMDSETFTEKFTFKLTAINLFTFLGLGINLSGSPAALYILTALGLGIRSGIFIYLFRQFFRGVPVELEEAAYIDGASPIQVFLKIMLPNARGAILLTAILTFVWQWNDNYYTLNFVSTNIDFQTLTTKIMGVKGNIQGAIFQAGVYSLFDQDVTKNPLFTSMILNTTAILSMIPLILFYIIVQKALFKEGVERSGLVG